MQKLETKADLCNKHSTRRAASHQVVSSPLQAGQVGLGGGRAVKSPRRSNHGPGQLRGSYCDGECQLQVACNSVTCSEECADCSTGLCLHYMSEQRQAPRLLFCFCDSKKTIFCVKITFILFYLFHPLNRQLALYLFPGADCAGCDQSGLAPLFTYKNGSTPAIMRAASSQKRQHTKYDWMLCLYCAMWIFCALKMIYK
jgi:hypothetical protein